MFQGETAITIDDKGRLAIPTAYRELVASACGNRLVLTYNPFENGCLYLYPQAVWEKVRDGVNAHRKGIDYRREVRKVTSGEQIELHLVPGGGFALKMKKI